MIYLIGDNAIMDRLISYRAREYLLPGEDKAFCGPGILTPR